MFYRKKRRIKKILSEFRKIGWPPRDGRRFLSKDKSLQVKIDCKRGAQITLKRSKHFSTVTVS